MDGIREKLHQKEAAFKEKYADVMNDLVTKYNKPIDIGYDLLGGIARAKLYPEEEQLYFTDIEYDEAEMVEEYLEIEILSKIINGDIRI